MEPKCNFHGDQLLVSDENWIGTRILDIRIGGKSVLKPQAKGLLSKYVADRDVLWRPCERNQTVEIDVLFTADGQFNAKILGGMQQ